MQHTSVQDLFREQIKHYSKKEQALDSQIIPQVLKWLKSKKVSKKIDICEFGGGAGQLLNEIRKSYPKANYINVEIVPDYKNYLPSKDITFVTGTVLNSGFPDNSFDILIMRDVIHHLVGNSYQETVNNQKLALQELRRLAKPGGVIFIEELTNGWIVISLLIYLLTKLNSYIGLRSSVFSINPNTIVLFLTHSGLVRLCEIIFKKKNILKKDFMKPKMKIGGKMAHFGSPIIKVFLLIRK